MRLPFPFSLQVGKWPELPHTFLVTALSSLLQTSYLMVVKHGGYLNPVSALYSRLTQGVRRGQKHFLQKLQPNKQDVFGKGSIQLLWQELGKGNRSLSCNTFHNAFSDWKELCVPLLSTGMCL